MVEMVRSEAWWRFRRLGWVSTGLRPKYEPAARTEDGADYDARSCVPR
jgi:hypothetical protein